jgi:proteic killer suppression protein
MRTTPPKAFRPTPWISSARCLPYWTTWKTRKSCGMLPSWKAHTLTGDRKGTWSLSVTANWRLTFRIDTTEREIYDVNLEDYH